MFTARKIVYYWLLFTASKDGFIIDYCLQLENLFIMAYCLQFKQVLYYLRLFRKFVNLPPVNKNSKQ